MNYFEILLPLALILLLSKNLSIVCRRLGLPQVVGMLVAGLLLGLIELIPNQPIFTTGEHGTMEGLSFIAKIGVILIMFSAGIETDLSQFKKVGGATIVITTLGVVVPLGLGFVVATLFNGGFGALAGEKLYDNLFYGTVLAATSVSVTVATLKEMGKLNSKVGTAIVAAAILDDVIGVILLSLFIGLKNTGSAMDVLVVLGKSAGFFAVAIGVGILIHLLFKWMDDRWSHKRRLPIFGFATCFLYAYFAEKIFGVADITGAYFAGLVLSGLHNSSYIDQKIEMSNYMIFAPVFFANIGITTSFSGIDGKMIGFGVAFVAAGLLGKLLGAGIGAKICKYSFKDSLRVGIGMMARAEVVLVCAQKGIDNGMLDSAIMPFVLILIILSSLLTPLCLKWTYSKELSAKNTLKPLEICPACGAALSMSEQNSPSQTEEQPQPQATENTPQQCAAQVDETQK